MIGVSPHRKNSIGWNLSDETSSAGRFNTPGYICGWLSVMSRPPVACLNRVIYARAISGAINPWR
jgi:hypothetical protein